jgi:chromosome partitioning protein
MQTIVIASQKGGAGKTTLSGHLAVQAEAGGDGPVVVIDTDPQGGLAGWWNVRQATTPLFITPVKAGLQATLTQLKRQGIKLVIIDTPPQATESIKATMRMADLVLIPVTPSPHDLRAVGATVDLVHEVRKPMVFVVNRAQLRARITADTAVALSQHGTVAPITLHHRNDYATSMIDGRTVGELDPSSKSAAEVRELWTYLNKRLSLENRNVAAA